jgi:putative endonuclease
LTRERLRLGALGERLAAAHLESKGYRIVDRNWRCPEGEVDLVAERDGCLVFVEVRTRRGDAHGSPEESVTAAKAARLLAVAAAYIQAHPDAPADCRIDLVAVELSPQGRLMRVEQVEAAVEEPS